MTTKEPKELDFDVLEAERVRDYLDACRSQNNTEGTIDRKKSSLRVFDEWLSETKWNPERLYEWDGELGFGESHPAEEFEKWLAGTKGYADNTVSHRFYHARDFLRNLNVEVFNEHELDRSQKSQKVREHSFPWLSTEEYLAVRDAADSFRTALMIELGFETGIRREELASAKLDDDLDLNNRALTVQNLKREHEDKPPYRTVYYPQTTKLKLERWVEVDRKQYNYHDDSEYLFPSNHGPRYSTQRINTLFKEACEEAGIQEELDKDAAGNDRVLYTFHSLRHSFCYTRVNQGMPLNFLSKLTGDRIETLETYLEVRESDVRDAADRYRPPL